MKAYYFFLVVLVLLGSCREKEALEALNIAPHISDQEFEIMENSDKGTSVGRIVALDPDDDPLEYILLDQQPASAFSIDATTGELLVDQSRLLDFEKIQRFILQVQVRDQDRKHSQSAQATVVIHVLNRKEQAFLFLPNGLDDLDDDLVCSNPFLYPSSENDHNIRAVQSEDWRGVYHVRSFLHFNKFALPADAVIQEAILTLHCTHAFTDFSRRSIALQLFALDSSWEEGMIAWDLHPTALEQSVLDIILTKAIEHGFDGPVAMKLDVTKLLQNSIAETGTFYGFMLKLKYEDCNDLKMEAALFSSGDSPKVANRPTLDITILK